MMATTWRERTILLLVGAMTQLWPASTAAQSFPLTAEEIATSEAMAESLPRLAEEVLGQYTDSDRNRFLRNVFRLQLLTNRFEQASASLAELRASTPHAMDRSARIQFEILSAARLRERLGTDFQRAFGDAFREAFAELDNPTAARAARTILVSPREAALDLRWATPVLRGRTSISLQESLTLLRVYSNVHAHAAFAHLTPALVGEEEARRYLISPHRPIPVGDGASVCTYVIRPNDGGGPVPALLHFTIYADTLARRRDAILSAAHGYAGVISYTRGKVCSSDPVEPYVHDGQDAAAVIEWIARQAWSDGQVGMFGGSYSGFTAWAAAKHAPAPLRAMMVGAPAGPGIDVPMEGNVFWNFVYPWPFLTTNDRFLDSATYGNAARWSGLYREWYGSGAPYSSLPELDGTPNPLWRDWIAHPMMDGYWKAMIPQGAEYAKIDIPVLQTAGYFRGGPGAALHYYMEHTSQNPEAEHYLVLGPYDHFQAQLGVVTALGDTASFFAGYRTDRAARIDIVADLRFQWFDYHLRGGKKPTLLRDKVNYQVMGADRWGHAPSLQAMSDGRLRLFLNASRTHGPRFTLTRQPGADGTFIDHRVDLTDRSDIDRGSVGGLMAATIDTTNAIVLVSPALMSAVEVNGLLSGRLEFVTNKRDFDFMITPYELTTGGRYYQLAPFLSRASHVASLEERRLLTPGTVERLEFQSVLRVVSRRLSAGSRLVVVLNVVKNAGQQINYGTGADVSHESIRDAGEPLWIRWLPGSYVDFPTRVP